jgi:photosystem II stability/assembly factor-like uncharacterized protein
MQSAKIAAPARWRIGPGGTVQRLDEGGSWQTESTGASVKIAAVSTPSPTVCWVAGERGTVLVTIDGHSWQTVGSPATSDLVSIRATDDKTATVMSADGRTFSTADRGASWTAVVRR